MFFYNGHVYQLFFAPAEGVRNFTALYTSTCIPWCHASLVFTYDAASQASRDEAAATHDEVRGRCENWGVPFATLLLGMGASGEEAAALASPRTCLAAGYSPTSGKGICDALASLVEEAHAAGSRFPRGELPVADTSNLLHVLFGSALTDE